MQQWKATLSYDGTPYHGWQVQPELVTVQGTLAAAIYHVTGETVLPQGSGRTDAGVHALGQVTSFALACEIPAANLQRALNRALPPSIRVLAVDPVEASFHARHGAVRKTYEYRIFAGSPSGDICSPMLALYVWDCPMRLDLKAMQRAAGMVEGTHDFRSFAATEPDLTARMRSPVPDHATNVRTVVHSCWDERDGLLVYRVVGSGFLHHMVRNLVGTFVEVGTGRTQAEAVPEILAARRRAAAGPTAPARGLFLVGVEY